MKQTQPTIEQLKEKQEALSNSVNSLRVQEEALQASVKGMKGQLEQIESDKDKSKEEYKKLEEKKEKYKKGIKTIEGKHKEAEAALSDTSEWLFGAEKDLRAAEAKVLSTKELIQKMKDDANKEIEGEYKKLKKTCDKIYELVG